MVDIMIAPQLDDWVERLKFGTLDVSDLRLIEALRLPNILERLSGSYPIRFLFRQQRTKQEIGLARTHRVVRRQAGTTHTFQDCLLLTSESDQITTLAAMPLLRVRVRRSSEGIDLDCGAGFSLYRDPDGWKIKLLEERTIRLSRQALSVRGWRLKPVEPTARSELSF
jgi:hypothetical protein